MGNIQQITQPETFTPPAMLKGGNNENVEKTSASFHQPDDKPVDAVVKEVEKTEKSSEKKEDKRNIEKETDIATSILHNKLKIVSDDRSRTGLVVKVLDSESGDTIKQFPSDEALNMIDRLKDSVVGVIVDDKV
ncbi:MAG: flagellar protein FlaG [Candidatus Anammoxibacter sp.]